MPAGIQAIDEKKKNGLLEAISTAGSVVGTAASLYNGGSKLLDGLSAPPDLGDPGFDKLPAAEAVAPPMQSSPGGTLNEAFMRRQKALRGIA